MRSLRFSPSLLLGVLLISGCLPRPGGVQGEISIAIRRPSSVDPVHLRDAAGILIARQVFETLTEVDPWTSELSAGLATWQVHDGGTRFVFRLNSGAKFHNGRAVTAEDVRFSLNRLAHKNTGSEVAFLLDAVTGFDKTNVTGEAKLEGVQALDARTIEIKTSVPWVDFPYVLSHPSTAPIPKQEFEASTEAFEQRPIGAGDYAFTAPIQTGKDILLAAAGGGGRGLVDRVKFVIYDRDEDGYQDFEDGRVDIAEVPPNKIDVARAKYGEAGFSSLAAAMYLGINLRNPKFGDVRFRRALSMGIDRLQIARGIYSGALEPAAGLVPAGIPGRHPRACGKDCDRDVPGAARLVREVFADGSPSVAFDFPTGASNAALARTLAANLKEIGVALEARPRVAEVTSYFDLIASGGQELFLLPWPAEYPLADWFLNPLFRSGSPDNHTGYSVAEVDELLQKARAAPLESDRLGLYEQIEKRVMADMPVLPAGFFRSRLVAADDVDGFYIDRLGSFEIARFR